MISRETLRTALEAAIVYSEMDTILKIGTTTTSHCVLAADIEAIVEMDIMNACNFRLDWKQRMLRMGSKTLIF